MKLKKSSFWYPPEFQTYYASLIKNEIFIIKNDYYGKENMLEIYLRKNHHVFDCYITNLKHNT